MLCLCRGLDSDCRQCRTRSKSFADLIHADEHEQVKELASADPGLLIFLLSAFAGVSTSDLLSRIVAPPTLIDPDLLPRLNRGRISHVRTIAFIGNGDTLDLIVKSDQYETLKWVIRRLHHTFSQSDHASARIHESSPI